MEKDAIIYKELKRRMNLLNDTYGYEVAFVSLQGSQNYGMDIYTDEYKSDIDCIAVILPSIDDFIANKQAVSTTIVLDNNEHINVKDIRLVFDLFYKQNIQFLEILFTRYRIVNKKYKNELKQLFDCADRIANYDRLRLFNGISGMAKEKLKALEHPYPSIIDKIEKYGYDGKQLSHIIRLHQVIRNLISGMKFYESINYFDKNIKELCFDTKLNKVSLETARYLAQYYSDDIHDLKEKYFEDKENVTDDGVVNILLNVKLNVLKKYIVEQLQPQIKEEFKLCPDQYRNVWVTSDTHFGHNNILTYENRLERLNVTTLEEHDEELIRRWNSKVAKDDLILILGDFSFKKATDTEVLLNRLNGNKILVRGNHDIFLDDKKFDKSLFKEIYDYKEIKYKGQEVALMHYPIQEFKHMNRDGKPSVLLFGHIHTFKMTIPKHSFNVGVDVNDFYPVRLDDAIQKALENEGDVING